MAPSGARRRILDVAARYRAGLTPLENGHYTVYHDDLRAAADRLGLELIVLADADSEGPSGVVPCLTGRDARAIADAVVTHARAGDVVMVYEGWVDLLDALVPVARSAPETTFVVNLFRPEGFLDGRVAPNVAMLEAMRALGGRLPSNLRITAETPERVELARAAGLPVRAAWSLHSIVTTVPAADAPVDDASVDRPLRVLVPLRPKGFDPGPVSDIAYVAHRLDRILGKGRVLFAVPRPPVRRLAAQVRGDRLARRGVEIIEPSGRTAEYAAMIAAHDAVWIVGSFTTSAAAYRTQSSGKALDALAVGRPVVSVAGSSPVRESQRWTGEALGHRDRDEAVEVFLDLVRRAPELRHRLAFRASEIRTNYSPELTLLRVLDVADQSGDGWGEPILDRPPDLAEDAAGFLRDPRSGPDDRRDRMMAGLSARWVARIPINRRIRFEVRRNLSAARSRWFGSRGPR